MAILESRYASAHRKPQFHPHKQLIALTSFKIINYGLKTIRNIDASSVLLKNRCPKTIGRKEKGAWWVGFLLTSAITRGWHYGLRDCGRVGLIMRCETPCSRDEICEVEVGTDERRHNRPQAPLSFTQYLRGCKRAGCAVDRFALAVHMPVRHLCSLPQNIWRDE